MKHITTGKELKNAIAGKGLTHLEAADLIGISRATLSTYFKYGEFEPEMLAEILGKLGLNGSKIEEHKQQPITQHNTTAMENEPHQLKLIEHQNRTIELQNETISLQKDILQIMVEEKKITLGNH